MTYDFHKLKTVSFADGEVKLRIPRRWDVWPDETRAGYWGCYEEEVDGRDTDSGTLWVQVDHYDWDGDDCAVMHFVEKTTGVCPPVPEPSELAVTDRKLT